MVLLKEHDSHHMECLSSMEHKIHHMEYIDWDYYEEDTHGSTKIYHRLGIAKSSDGTDPDN